MPDSTSARKSSANHIEAAILHDFLLGRLEASANRRIVRHLLTGCQQCQEVAESFWLRDFGAEPEIETERLFESHREPCFDHVLLKVKAREKQLANERELAEALFRELEPHPLGRQLMVVRNSARFRTWGLCEHLLRMSWSSRFDDVTRTTEYAELAVAVAEILDTETYGTALVNDLQGRAWAYLANAHRIRSDYRAADEAFQTAETRISNGTADPLEKARFLDLKSILYCDQDRYEESKGLLDRVISIYERLGDQHLVGAALVEMGRVLAYMGHQEAAIGSIHRALELMDPSTEPHRILVARHIQIHLLQETGRLDEALALLKETRPLFVQLGDRLSLLRLRRLEGQIADTMGHYAMAERAFLEARNGFIGQGMGHDAAEISLELAALYLGQGRTVETCQLAVQMLPIFQARDLDREVLAALIVFKQAVETETATVGLAREILAKLERASGDKILGLDG